MLLMSPYRLGPVTIPNRIVLTAMVTRLSGEDGHVNKDVRDRYLRFARGEPGLMVLEAMAVHSAKSGPLLRISSDDFKPALSDLCKAIHDRSPSKVVPQIIHFLKISRSGWRQKVTDLDAAELPAIVEAYAQAAARARECGFDGVELHMSHAYTLSSFLSRLNVRHDAYGGKSLEKRLRLPTETLAAVRRAVGADFMVGVRFDGEEGIRGGYSVPEAAEIALRFARTGADYLSLSAGGKFEDALHKPGEPLYPYTGFSGDRCMPGAEYPGGMNVYISEGVKAHLRAHGVETPVVATGKIGTPELAESILQAGKADLIGMARALLADPDLPRKVRLGQGDHIVRCVYGNVCKALDENFRRVVCTLWPKGALQAPQSEDADPPRWPQGGARLRCAERQGRIELHWEPATDGEAVYGYQVFRAVDGGAFQHLSSVRGPRLSFADPGAVRGARYRYQVKAYDLAGNRSEPSNAVDVALE
jgi:2,4-dienoyl-CoA reductase-like NADH-dependent reductase (Old Yellow Enzyme family)